MMFDELKASDLMSRGLWSVEPRQTLAEAAQLMAEHRVHCLVVPAASESRAPGVIACKDVIQLLSDSDPSILGEILVEEAMTSPAISVRSDLCISDCLNLMRMAGVRSVPVLDGKQPVGVLSFTDIMVAAVQR